MGKTLLTPRHSFNAFFRSPPQLEVRTRGSQQKLTAHFAFSSVHNLKFDVYHEARQSSIVDGNVFVLLEKEKNNASPNAGAASKPKF